METAKVWKVLIADDEPIIREGIRSAIDWPSLGLTVAGEAEDGEEALEKVLAERIDILLVDLNMPIMNGLTLIGRVREELPSCKVVIITGHDEFAYAQEAIRLDVDDYILKPVNPSQLHAVLEKLAASLAAAESLNERLAQASRQIEKNMPHLRQQFCLAWTEGDLSETEVKEQLAFLRLPVREPAMLGIIRWVERPGNRGILSEKDRQLLLYALENVAGELLAPFGAIHFRDRQGFLVFLMWGMPEEGDQVKLRVEEAASAYLDLTVMCRFIRCEQGLEAVPGLYALAKSQVMQDIRLSSYVRKAQALIETKFGDPELTLERVAGELNVSAVYLSRIFKQETGVTFVGQLTQTRMKGAIRLLNETELSIAEIAESVGYETQHYFSTAFKKAIGIPPNQFRKAKA